MALTSQPVQRSSFDVLIGYSRRAQVADYCAMLMAVSLPWSTTAFGIFTLIWLVAVAAIVDVYQFFLTVRRRPWLLSTALFVLAVLGVFWSTAPWSVRLHAASTMIKLLAIPLFVYQFDRSENGPKVLYSFYLSCVALLFLSWLHRFNVVTVPFSELVPGVPVKNWITQGVEFALCIFGSVALSAIMWRRGRTYLAVVHAILGLVFLLNLVFVPSSRTSLISLLVLLPILSWRYIGWRWSVMMCALLAVFGGISWFASSTFRERVDSIHEQLVWYENGTVQASVGLRLEYWHKSLGFVREAPVFGHGTGSIRPLFEREASGKSITQAEIVANPHNQTLYVAIEWGIVGVILLWAMWGCHFLLFTEFRWMSWLGTLIVSQSIFDSLFNSHLSDYVEGWIYVMGVGICAGLRSWNSQRSVESPANSP